MANPLFQSLMGNMAGNLPPKMQQLQQMQQIRNQFEQFARGFRGDPRQQVQQMLNSGQLSQEQYNRAAQMATQFRQMMGF